MDHSRILLAALGLLGATTALAADKAVPATPLIDVEPPTWSVVGSLSPTYTDNALFTRTDRRRDVYLEPDVSLRLDGRLSPDVSYRLYARTLFDTFADVKEANEASVRLGGRLTRTFSDWRASIYYERRYEYEGVYRDRLFAAHDVSASLARDFTVSGATLTPGILVTYRFADLPDVRRYRLDLLLPIEIPIDERWAFVSTPMIELFWFTDGLNSGRRDQIYSASLGLRYRISDNITLTNSVLFERRTSNVPLRHYNDIEVGPKLDFAF